MMEERVLEALELIVHRATPTKSVCEMDTDCRTRAPLPSAECVSPGPKCCADSSRAAAAAGPSCVDKAEGLGPGRKSPSCRRRWRGRVCAPHMLALLTGT